MAARVAAGGMPCGSTPQPTRHLPSSLMTQPHSCLATSGLAWDSPPCLPLNFSATLRRHYAALEHGIALSRGVASLLSRLLFRACRAPCAWHPSYGGLVSWGAHGQGGRLPERLSPLAAEPRYLWHLLPPPLWCRNSGWQWRTPGHLLTGVDMGGAVNVAGGVTTGRGRARVGLLPLPVCCHFLDI